MLRMLINPFSVCIRSYSWLKEWILARLRPLLERSYGSYTRSFDISGVDADKIKAKYVDGVLRLTLPKLEQRLPEGRRLEIE